MRVSLLLLALLGAAAPVRDAAAARGLTLRDQFQVSRLGEPAVSPDGRWIVFSAATLDRDANARQMQLYLLPTAGGAGPRRLTNAGKINEQPAWAPDSRSLAYTSHRDGAPPEIYLLDVTTGAEKRLTDRALGAGGPLFSRDGKWIAFVSDTFPQCADDACNKAREQAMKSSPVKAREFSHLFIRHWKDWRSGARQHLFVMPAGGGPARELTRGDEDAPTWRLNEPADYTFTPDGHAIVYATKAAREEAWSTNSDLWEVPIVGSGPTRRLTKNAADDATPRFSPDGSLLAWRAQARPGYESDRWRLMVMDWKSGRAREATPDYDRWVSEIVFAPDGKSIVVAAEDRGRSVVWAVSPAGGAPRPLTGELSAGDFAPTPDGGLVFVGSTAARMPELYRVPAGGGAPQQLSQINAALAREVELPPFEPLEATGADGVRLHAFLAKPPGFRAGTRYPLLVLIHGGPQGAWHDDFGSIRWSPQLYAARGYVVLLPNPRGSTGWGQAYVDGVNRDWGGKPYDDILRLTEAAARLPYVDGGRACALGASFGGFMVNWIQGHSDRFRCLVSHAGLFDQFAMYYDTEELWFPEWEFGGPPWKAPALYEKFSPSRTVERFRTPELVTHGELDFRVPVGEGIGMFTALQRRGVPSKLLVFPDEGHWISKPQNLERWLGTIWDFVDGFLKAKRQARR